jgi:hypothetical protein
MGDSIAFLLLLIFIILGAIAISYYLKLVQLKSLKEYTKAKKTKIIIAILFLLVLSFIVDPALAATIVFVAVKIAAFYVIGYGLYLGYKRLRGE